MIGWTEALGFITGAASVWLAVRQNVWNWPVGIANNVFFIILFAQSRLYADMSLQVFYIVISAWGIYEWMRGGAAHTGVPVTRIPRREIPLLFLILCMTATAVALYLSHVNDASPVLDAFTTIASLIAQFLLARKVLENWYVWIAVDVASIGLYASRSLYLTAVLYAIFLVMCVIGVRAWRRSLA